MRVSQILCIQFMKQHSNECVLLSQRWVWVWIGMSWFSFGGFLADEWTNSFNARLHLITSCSESIQLNVNVSGSSFCFFFLIKSRKSIRKRVFVAELIIQLAGTMTLVVELVELAG